MTRRAVRAHTRKRQFNLSMTAIHQRRWLFRVWEKFSRFRTRVSLIAKTKKAVKSASFELAWRETRNGS